MFGSNDNYYYTQQYDNNYYGSQYDPYAYNNSGYSNSYPQYQTYYTGPYTFGYQPYGYQPYNYSYSNSPYGYGSYDDYSYLNSQYGYQSYDDYSNSPYGNGGYPYYSNYSNSFPLAYATNSYGGGGFLSRLFSQLLAVGYDNGYQQGQYAVSNGYNDQYYYDPYGYQDTGYNGYDQYSYSMGENRRYLSEGYQLGYQDAMNRNNQYDPYSSGSRLDLVSLLIGNVLDRG